MKPMQKVFHGKTDDDAEKVNRGGVMILQTLENLVDKEFTNRYDHQSQKKQQEKVLDGIGY